MANIAPEQFAPDGIKKESMENSLASPNRFHSLDVLRGLGAAAVVLWHWQHFFFNGAIRGDFSPGAQPFHGVLWPFYDHGHLAVSLFFTISGFIFFWLYSDQISRNRLSLWDFQVLRVSRLLPLHLATLLMVVFGQAVLSRTGAPILAENNDAYHFVLNLVLANNWGLERGFSFNAPSWSVSVEMLLYVMFFWFCRSNLRGPLGILGAIAAGYVVMRWVYAPVGLGMICFFAGAAVFRVYEKVRKHVCGSKFRCLAVVVGTLGLWVVVLLNREHNWCDTWVEGSFLKGKLMVGGHDLLKQAAFHVNWLSFELVLFPCTILALALVETARGHWGKRFSWIGNMSYSMYLIHFPLQVIALAVALGLGYRRDVFYNHYMWVIFFSTLLLLSWLSYRYLEMPSQRKLRSILLRARGSRA
jgi:peptidoglycan/LPS O-acetylase OafA/YrhL